MPSSEPSERLVLQRMRNRAIEALEVLAGGDAAVREVGVGNYVEWFFDIIDDRSPADWRSWNTLTADEVAALDEVHSLVVAACDATPGINDVDGFLASGWPARIQPPATRTLDLMLGRGRYREDQEEAEPSVHR